MFGLSFGELVVVGIVGLVVLGPKELPKMLRKLGQWAGRLRRMALDLRAQSGIDEILRGEGIADDLREITKLARGELDGVVAAARVDGVGYGTAAGAAAGAAGASGAGTAAAPTYDATGPGGVSHDPYLAHNEIAGTYGVSGDLVEISKEREYPLHGADHYGAIPETAVVYAELLPVSALATDPTYTQGIPTPADPTIPKAPPEPHGEAGADGLEGDATDAGDATVIDAVPASVLPGAGLPGSGLPGSGSPASGPAPGVIHGEGFNVEGFAAESRPENVAAPDEPSRPSPAPENRSSREENPL